MQNGRKVKTYDPEKHITHHKCSNYDPSMDKDYSDNLPGDFTCVPKDYISMMKPKNCKVYDEIASGSYKVWVGKDPSKCYNNKKVDLEGISCTPGFWQ